MMSSKRDLEKEAKDIVELYHRHDTFEDKKHDREFI